MIRHQVGVGGLAIAAVEFMGAVLEERQGPERGRIDMMGLGGVLDVGLDALLDVADGGQVLVELAAVGRAKPALEAGAVVHGRNPRMLRSSQGVRAEDLLGDVAARAALAAEQAIERLLGVELARLGRGRGGPGHVAAIEGGELDVVVDEAVRDARRSARGRAGGCIGRGTGQRADPSIGRRN
jgi:hypothetical protein